MKLELKHLSPYLPYGLKIKYLLTDSIQIEQVIGLGIDFVLTTEDDYSLESIKPILRPLSDLDNEVFIESVSDFEFIPCEVFEDHISGWCDAYNEWWNLQYPNFLQMMDSCPYEVMQQLLEWHFDVFGLIDQNLAIDINTI